MVLLALNGQRQDIRGIEPNWLYYQSPFQQALRELDSLMASYQQFKKSVLLLEARTSCLITLDLCPLMSPHHYPSPHTTTVTQVTILLSFMLLLLLDEQPTRDGSGATPHQEDTLEQPQPLCVLGMLGMG